MFASARSLLTVEQVAQCIDWHPESVRRAIRQGRLHAVKLGRGWRISEETMENVRLHGIPCLGGLQ
jgi:excisionase family DNA binding protein